MLLRIDESDCRILEGMYYEIPLLGLQRLHVHQLPKNILPHETEEKLTSAPILKFPWGKDKSKSIVYKM